ncbi:Imm7 family immunity protein [Orbus wheelerorum]|uniref:Imm7 family immunity protein n=1 Tax=Orbus wheelerorum TaxID=3074111 RepID=UPI00370D3840
MKLYFIENKYQLINTPKVQISAIYYGLLHLKNDESDDAFNEFGFFVLARGKIRKEKDPFLSPCIPTIEDGE